MPEVRTRKIRATGTSPALIVATLSDGDTQPLGGPRWTHTVDPAFTVRDNHQAAAEAFGIERLGLASPSAGNWRHAGYGTFHWTVTDASALEDTPELPPVPDDHVNVPLDLLRNARTELLLAATNPRIHKDEQDRIQRVYDRLVQYAPLSTY
jgi:hypothetical protein